MGKLRESRIVAIVLALLLVIVAIPVISVSAATSVVSGTPYTEDGTYDVNIEHVVINQVYGASDDGYADHSFIELYNPTDEDINLSGWVIAYKSSSAGDQADEWATLELTGTIPANGYYLIRCAEVTDASNVTYEVEEGDQEWDISIYNKGVSVALFCQSVTLTDDFSGEVTDDNRPDGYVDLVAVQGNDGKTSQIPPVYEGSYSADQSKKKSVRRSNYSDTDVNSTDLTTVDYSKTVSDEDGPHSSGLDQDDEDETKVVTYTTSSYEEDASLNLELANSISIGSEVNADGGVAEIVAYNSDTGIAYAVNGQDGKLYYFSVTSDGLTLEGSLDVSTLIEDEVDGFTYGDLTSVAVDTVNDHIALAVQAYNYYDNGRVLLLDYDLNVITTFETGVQPDMVTFTPDGSCILTADEGEPREGYGVGAVDPAGTVTIINLEKETITYVGFEMYSEDADTLSGRGVIIRKVKGTMCDPAYDLEPEYIAVSSDGSTAYVSLQEANAVAIIDIESGTLTTVTGLGFKDYSEEENAVDLQDDDQYLASTYTNVYGVYMPDSISVYEVDGVTYLVTANEGDVSEWGDYTNERKVTLTDTYGKSTTVRALDNTQVEVPDSAAIYLFGGRSFAIYQVGDDGSLTQVYESGSDFEEITAEYLSEWFNCSNDDVEIDSRSQKKGVEPEGVAIGTIGDKTYAFIGLERIGGIMVYDITDPTDATYVNYINTRDFSEDIAGDVSPEGLAFISLSDGTPMLLVAYEVSGTVAAYTFTDADGEAVTAASSSASYDAYTVEEHNSYEITAQQDATCTEDGYITYTCSFCNDTYTEVLEATGHTESEAVQENVVDATCETDGSYDSVVYCSVCGAEISRETVTIEATGHSWDDENVSVIWADDYSSVTVTWICTVCGETYTATDCVITSTENGDGTVTYTVSCTGPDDCSYTFDVIIYVEQASDTVQTGDDANAGFWFAILIVAALCFLICKRKIAR